MSERRGSGVVAVALGAALAVYAAALLSIGLDRDWRLIHEDNGAMHTTLALSHTRLGVATTRAHDLFVDRHTGQAFVYGHHPPATALLLAGLFTLTGSDAPWVGRLMAMTFHLGSIALLVRLLSRVLPGRMPIVGGFVMATLPMSAYFGRMVNYEPLCLFAVLVALNAYAAVRQQTSTRELGTLAAGIVLGGLIDWAALFFAAAIILAEVVDVWSGQSPRRATIAVTLVSTVGVTVFDVCHLWYAGHGTLALYGDMLRGQWPAEWKGVNPLPFARSELEIWRRYLTHAGVTSSLLVAVCLLASRSRLAVRLFDVDQDALLKRLLGITGGAACAYMLAAPSWAEVHAYWQFYALPFVVLSIMLVGQALWRAATAPRATVVARALLVVFIAEVLLSSATMLYYRHTTPSAHAIRQTERFRASFLAPASASRD